MPTNRSFPVFKLLVFTIVLILPLYSVFIMTPLFSKLVVGNLEGNAEQLARHISRMFINASGDLPPDSISASMKEEAGNFLRDFEINKLRVFSTDGTIIFSTTEEDIGNSYPKALFWNEIASGATYSKIVKKESSSVDQEKFHHDVIETYYPLVRDNLVVGAIEIYTNIDTQQESLALFSKKHNLLIVSVLLLMGAVFIVAEEREKRHLRTQQKFQNQIFRAKAEWEKTVDAIDDVIAIVDLSFTIQRINKAGRERFNAPFPELLGHKCFEVLEQSDVICPDCPIPKVLEDGKTHHCELFSASTGHTFWISVAPLFDENGHINSFVHTSRDITHLKVMEQQMQRNQRRESLAVLTRGIAHNFRNILASILMNSQVLQSNHKDDQQIKEITGWINESVQSGSKLVTGLMQFSQHKTKKDFHPLDLAQLIPDTYELIRSSIGKDINLTYNIPQSLEIMGDPGALFQVLANICSNSADAMPRGGDLRINLQKSGAKALIIITDTGSGIDQGILDKIFEPFFTTKDVDKGTGLGLSSSYGIIKEHGGNIQIESTVNVGTTVTITLPLTNNGITENQLTSLREIEGFGQRILLVDDEEQIIIPMTRLLAKAGYQVAGAKNCEEALTKLNSWRPHLVILDYNMPDRNGIDCATEVNRLDPSVKIIILSGIPTEDLEEIIAKRGVEYISCCLEKPIGIVKLNRAMADIFGKPGEKGNNSQS
ncbi:MAG: ATP-binding protein [Thermodesulfobacteriota bacterium]